VVRVPGDKSVSHRALMLSCLAAGRSRVDGILASADVESTARCLRALGYDVPPLGRSLIITGRGTAPLPDAATRAAALACGNSGTTARLLAGIAAARPAPSTVSGDPSLSARPMQRVADPLQQMGAEVEWRGAPGRLPMSVRRGPRGLTDIEYRLPVASAQVKSAILLAALAAGVRARVVEPVPTRDHTEHLLAAMGAAVDVAPEAITLGPTRTLAPLDVAIPADPSSAAFFIALALLADEGTLTIRNVLLNPRRTGLLRVLQRMGARIETSDLCEANGELVGTLTARPSELRGAAIAGAEVASLIDEVPVLAVLASCAAGETEIRDASELRVKESDRLAALADNLAALGARAEQLPDGLRIEGDPEWRPRDGARIATHGDHRIAMAFGVLAAARAIVVQFDDAGCVDVSYPTFWDDLATVLG
jgi:3-phosphoshikimate 1-carboxyvinyltransferase